MIHRFRGHAIIQSSICDIGYNVGPVYQAVYRRRPAAAIEEIGPQTDPFHPNKVGAYLFSLPPDWVTAQGLGSKTMVTGFSREAGAFGGSQRPTLFADGFENGDTAAWSTTVSPVVESL